MKIVGPKKKRIIKLGKRISVLGSVIGGVEVAEAEICAVDSAMPVRARGRARHLSLWAVSPKRYDVSQTQARPH